MNENFSLSDVAAVTRGNDCYGNGMFGGEWMMWIFALLLLPGMFNGGGFWGNNGRGNAATTEDLCMQNSFAELKNSVGRGFDQQTQFAFQNQRDLCEVAATLSSQIAAAAAAQEKCCCETKSDILENRYLAAQNTASINANTTAQVQKVLDAICGNRMADMQNQINQLQLNNALCGIVRYPTQTTYATNCNPFFGYGGGYDCNRYCNGNI